MKPYTVLLLRPTHQREGHPSDWVYRAWVTAANPDEADLAAVALLAQGPDDTTPAEPSEVSTLAIYEGHLFDIFQP